MCFQQLHDHYQKLSRPFFIVDRSNARIKPLRYHSSFSCGSCSGMFEFLQSFMYNCQGQKDCAPSTVQMKRQMLWQGWWCAPPEGWKGMKSGSFSWQKGKLPKEVILVLQNVKSLLTVNQGSFFFFHFNKWSVADHVDKDAVLTL